MIRLGIRVRREQAEIVLAEVLELAPGGVEEVPIGEDVVEYAVYGPPGELPALPALSAAAGGALVELRTEEIADDWPDRWRSFHKPVVLGDALTVRPPWERRGQTAIDLVIDPGQAFGTGAHATTRLSLELMLDLAPAGAFVDLGCGSGVLAIAAAALGWSPVIALDHDPVSVQTARENARVNGVQIDVRRHDLLSTPLPCAVPRRDTSRDGPAVAAEPDETGEAPTVAANLLGPLLLAWAQRLADAPTVPARVIASGLLVEEADAVAAAFAARGLRQSARCVRGEWAALLLERSTAGSSPGS
ncbi:MAG: 50S ribosomal protein L11 methyltransferase [Solirubrobacteraceae bacterium]